MKTSHETIDAAACSAPQTGDPGSVVRSKRSYAPPALVEWGSLVDLTQGEFAGFDDPVNGSSQPV